MSGHMKGVLIGIVASLDDPEELGRVQLTYPTLGDVESNWARVATPLAGPELGMYFQPEIGDEALVAFEMDDINRPYIIGYLWSGGSLPPTTEPRERLIQSVQGNKITLYDTDDKGMTFEDANGHTIIMNSDGITIKDVNDNVIEMTSSGINITSNGEITIKGSMIKLNP
jgi:uncharacterized protein involved in type VI secretion and phage assembly